MENQMEKKMENEMETGIIDHDRPPPDQIFVVFVFAVVEISSLCHVCYCYVLTVVPLHYQS